MEGMSNLMECWEDLWASCATLLKDLSKEEQAKAAYLVLNDACISTFLPSSSPEPPSPMPTTRPVSPKKQTNKPGKNNQTTRQSVVPNKQKETRAGTEVKKEATVSNRRQVVVVKKRLSGKAKTSLMSSYKGMKLRVKQEPRDPLSVNQSQAQAKAKTAPHKSILKKRIDPKRANVNIKRERIEDSGRQTSRKSAPPTKVNIKKEFGVNGRRPNKRFRCYNDVQRSELNRTFDISAYPSTQVICFLFNCDLLLLTFQFFVALKVCYFFFKTCCFRTAEGWRVS